MIYVAHPYTTGKTNLTLREILVKVATFAYSAHLEKRILFHPVLMGENMLRWSGNLNRNENQSYKFWQGHDVAMISVSEAFWVLDIDGWADSDGVSNEIEQAHFFDIPTFLITEGKSHYFVEKAEFVSSIPTKYTILKGELRIEKHEV